MEFSLLLEDQDDYDDIECIRIINKKTSLYWEVSLENILFGSDSNRKQRLVNFKLYFENDFIGGMYTIKVVDFNRQSVEKEINIVNFKNKFNVLPKLEKDQKGLYHLKNQDELKNLGYVVELVFQELLKKSDTRKSSDLKRVIFVLDDPNTVIPFENYKGWSIYFYLENKGLNTFLFIGPYS